MDGSPEAGLRRFTREELAQADGREGRPALIAYEGKVYNVTASKLWRNGVHVRVHQAGEDLTTAIGAAPHGDEVLLDRFTPVGVLVDVEVGPAVRVPPPLFEAILRRHPHPITVHFPIALGIAAALFTFLSLFSPQPWRLWLQQAALLNLCILALATPPAIATGLLSWYYNYSAVWTPIYRAKTFLSITLAVLAAAALITRLGLMPSADPGGGWYWAYSLMVMALAPVVIALGYFGGKITFPS